MGIYLLNITQNKKTKAMKKFFAIAFIAATLVACNGGGEATPAVDTTAAAADTTAAADITAALQVGDSYQGGKIAYIYQVGDPGYVEGQTHGIIAAPSDQAKNIAWLPPVLNYEFPPAIGAGGKALGTGNTNTNQIVTAYGKGNYAAKLCYDLVLNGYDDWYLPSIDELEKLYVNRAAVGGFVETDLYWSSSEYDKDSAWYFYFIDDGGANYEGTKNDTRPVRAVRAF
jgi:hypothetical protein